MMVSEPFSDMLIWCAIITCGFITFLTRFLPLSRFMPKQIPLSVEKALDYVPAAVLTPIIITAILAPDGVFVIYENMRLPAAIFAVLIALLSGSIMLTLLSGLGILWLLNYLF